MDDTTRARLEEERSKCLARLSAQESQKCRHRTFFELASVEARLGRAEDAISALRDAVSCGLDGAYSEELLSSPHFESLRSSLALAQILDALNPSCAYSSVSSSFSSSYIYAKGERARCVADALLCSLCNEPLRQPMLHQECGNMFCAACIAAVAACPQCHEEVTQSGQLIKQSAKMIVSKLDTLKVHCPRCMTRCERAALPAHIATCPILCPHSCRQKILPSALDEHATQCTAVVVACGAHDVGCAWNGARRDLQGHERKCALLKQRPLLTRITSLESRLAKLEASRAAAVPLVDENTAPSQQ